MEKIFIEHLSLAAKLKPSALAIAAKLAPSTLNRRTRDIVQMEYSLSNKSLKKIADYLELPLEHLVAHRERILAALTSKSEIPSYVDLSIHTPNKKTTLKSSNAGSREELHSGPDLIPVLGTASGANDVIIINFDQEIGRVLRHPNQANVKNAFSVEVYGDSMSPRFKHGELAFINGGFFPTKDGDCLIELKDGGSLIKIFIQKTDKEITWAQLNPPKEVKSLLRDIKAIHAVVGRG